MDLPQRLRNLNLFGLGLGLGDAAIESLVRSPAWLERAPVSLDVQCNDLSSKGLATLSNI